jgi:hypothetical protein
VLLETAERRDGEPTRLPAVHEVRRTPTPAHADPVRTDDPEMGIGRLLQAAATEAKGLISRLYIRPSPSHLLTMTQDQEFENRALDMQDRLAMMTDREVRDAYLASAAEADDPWQRALGAECEARGIDL